MLFEKLKEKSITAWNSYIKHPFVISLGKGNLPQELFQEYLLQDYLFLIQFARAYGLGVYKARTLEDMNYALNGLKAILEQEISLHQKYCQSWGITDIDKIVPNTSTIAYTRYVLDVGIQGDLLDLHVALIPCIVGYAEIGTMLAQQSYENNSYASWIEMYSSKEYQEIAENAKQHLEYLGDRHQGIHRLSQLTDIFETATRMEAAFWPQLS